MHQKLFGGQASPGPAGGAQSTPRPPDAFMGEGNGEATAGRIKGRWEGGERTEGRVEGRE